MSQTSPETEKLRNLIRARTIGATRTFKRTNALIEFTNPETGEPEPTPVEVMQPSVGARGRILAASGVTKSGAVGDPAKMQILSIIECVVVPGTDDRVFSSADYDAIESEPTGGWPDKLWLAVQAATHVEQKAARKK